MNLDTISHSDVFDYVKLIPPKFIDMVVTSPPYYLLRDYGDSNQIGNEKTLMEYLENLANVFNVIRPKMKDSATLWVNLGDKYATDNMPDFSRKQLLLLPERFAILMTDKYGWTLRSSIVWHKSNAMPESVQDRPIKEDERLLMFSNKPKYYYDIDAVRIPYTESTIERMKRKLSPSQKYTDDSLGDSSRVHTLHRRKNFNMNPKGRNIGNVWVISTAQDKSAHVAPFPEKLIEVPILAGCPAGGVVFDPFMGSGTTAIVSKRLGRHFIGCDINPDYVIIAQNKLNNIYGE
jgi:DNA modification methylase